MKKKHMELLQYLLNHSTAVTSRQLAAALSISTRSVKNYVNEINLLGNHKVILSSKQGYTVQMEQAKELLSVKEESIPQTSLERGFYIVKQIMLEHSPTWICTTFVMPCTSAIPQSKRILPK